MHYEIIVHTKSGGPGNSHPLFTYTNGAYSCVDNHNWVVVGPPVKPMFNSPILQNRNDFTVTPVRGVTVTIMNQHRLCLASHLAENDEAEHAHAVFEKVAARHLPHVPLSVTNLAVYIDDAARFGPG